MNERESMEDETEIFQRLTALETKVNGGPGQSAICKIHEAAVAELRARLERIEQKFDAAVGKLSSRQAYWSGGLAVLMILLPIVQYAILKK